MTQAKPTIYSYPENVRVYKSLIAAQYGNVDVDVTTVQIGTDTAKPEFLAKFPLGKVPTMDTPEGPLYESDAMSYYFALKAGLVGSSDYEKALVLQFASFASAELLFNVQRWYAPFFGWYPYNKAEEQKAKDNLHRAMAALDKTLAKKTFLVGERITLADISVVCSLLNGYKMVLAKEWQTKYPHVLRHFVTCVNQPQFKKVVGEIKLVETAMVYDPKKAPKAEAKKEEKPKKEQPKKEVDLEELAEQEKKEEKKKNPLDELPPSSFVMDAWKRFYSNNETADAVKWFWENIDKEGYSLWKVTYKYNEELGAIFMSSNLIGGFFQRLDRARKYAFGSMIVTGEANNNKITGYFLFRGQDVPFEVTDAADYESYEFKKADWEQSKAEFNDYLKWEGSNLPGPFADGKIFK